MDRKLIFFIKFFLTYTCIYLYIISNRDRGVIEWKVRLVFPQAAGGERAVQLNKVDDTTRIHELFRPYVEPELQENSKDPFLSYRCASSGKYFL